MAGQQPVAVQQSAFGAGEAGTVVGAQLHLAVVEVRRSRLAPAVLERLRQRPAHRRRLRRAGALGAEHRHVPVPDGIRLLRAPVVFLGEGAAR
ncbi:hypothetical protein [Streptomyces sp. MK5]|uniref:hypothetical protein n=1 Tax=Streptomyces sp. MK5 TaxID=3064253 RepID=UPI00274073D3|nr:hypothetical protein [Streptomyces sp. MK5]